MTANDPAGGMAHGPASAAGEKKSILVLNSGSSSVKFALFALGSEMRRTWTGALQPIGATGGRFHAEGEGGARRFDEESFFPDHEAALAILFPRIEEWTAGTGLVAVGHRVVHGGADCDRPMRVTESLEDRLRELTPLAPLHLPHNLAGIAAVRERRPDLPQVACFDTAFHHGLPRVARMTGLPRMLRGQGIRRYGFHGLSYEYVLAELDRREGPAAARQRLVVAHLGDGASMAAIHNGKSVETSMGFSALGGLLMGTRCGDLDPGIVLHLLTEKGMTAEDVRRLLHERSGLLGISGISRNMRDLLDKRHVREAAEAIELFCYRARHYVGALTAALGGLDRLVFTGGIGANAPEVRARICDGLAYLGIVLDPPRNHAGDSTISAVDGSVVVQAFVADEELMIARHTARVVSSIPVAQEV